MNMKEFKKKIEETKEAKDLLVNQANHFSSTMQEPMRQTIEAENHIIGYYGSKGVVLCDDGSLFYFVQDSSEAALELGEHMDLDVCHSIYSLPAGEQKMILDAYSDIIERS